MTTKGLRSNTQLEVTTLASIQDIFVGGHEYKGAGFFDQGRLLSEPMLLLQREQLAITFFDEVTHGACSKPRFELSSVDVLLDLVEINMGIAMLPQCGARKMQRRYCRKELIQIFLCQREISYLFGRVSFHNPKGRC